MSLEEKISVLVVDDEEEARRSLQFILRLAKVSDITLCKDGEEAKDLLVEKDIDIVFADLTMPKINGEELLKHIKDEYPSIQVVLITGHDDVDTAVRCMRAGASDYIVKPVDKDRFITLVTHLAKIAVLEKENIHLKRKFFGKNLVNPKAFSSIVTANDNMFSLFHYLEAIAPSSRHILITGETGTGKELFARALHNLSGREGALVAVNAASLSDDIFADTLFGHKRGAFTGADRERDGLITKAENGTLFLDEIGDLSLGSQVSLLRLLQEQEYFPVGSDKPKRTNARIVAATNYNLEDLVDKRHFRKDLYYRLNAYHIRIPPLRDRLDDIPLLLEHFVKKSCEEIGRRVSCPKELSTLLKNYDFPGNVRELEGMISSAISRASKSISLDAFRPLLGVGSGMENEGISDLREALASLKILPSISEAESALIEEALKRTDNNQTIASGILGISRQSLNRKLKVSD